MLGDDQFALGAEFGPMTDNSVLQTLLPRSKAEIGPTRRGRVRLVKRSRKAFMLIVAQQGRGKPTRQHACAERAHLLPEICRDKAVCFYT